MKVMNSKESAATTGCKILGDHISWLTKYCDARYDGMLVVDLLGKTAWGWLYRADHIAPHGSWVNTAEVAGVREHVSAGSRMFAIYTVDGLHLLCVPHCPRVDDEVRGMVKRSVCCQQNKDYYAGRMAMYNANRASALGYTSVCCECGKACEKREVCFDYSGSHATHGRSGTHPSGEYVSSCCGAEYREGWPTN